LISGNNTDGSGLKDIEEELPSGEDLLTYAAIQQAYQMSNALRFSNKFFNPRRLVQRQEVLYDLVNSLNLRRSDIDRTPFAFDDSAQITNDEVKAAIATALENELIVNPVKSNQLKPCQEISRAELAALIYQSLVIQGRVDRISSEYIVTPPQFIDIKGHWAEKRIITLTKLGIVKGFPDDTFKPNQSINRAEFAAILAQAFNPTHRSLQVELSDVPADFWARTAIERVVGSRLIAAAAANQFSPSGNVPRLQAVITLVNALLRKQKALPTPDRTMLSFFTDIDALQPSVQNRIAIAIQLGIVAKSSKNNTTFRPDQVVTRAEVSVMLLQVLAALESSQPPERPPVVPPVVPPTVPPAANPNPEFTDLKDHPAKDKILALVSRGIFTGFPDHTFKPDQSMLRAEFAAILVRAFQPASSTSKIEFRDVPANFWAWSVIQQVVSNGLMAGISGNQFGPKQPITQLQTVVNLVHCLRKQQKTLPTPDRTALSFFADINSLAAEEKDCIAIAIQLGWIARSSRSNTQFHPNSPVTRATVATILLQALSV
ncbi:MAG TPA: S-layer homology domain-containing protein, partial [Chroococcidiopsis sp.]